MAVIRLHQQGICVFITLGQTTSGFYPPYLEPNRAHSPFLMLSLPHFPQLPSKIYLGKMQISKCTVRIDVTTTRIVSNKFALYRTERKQ